MSIAKRVLEMKPSKKRTEFETYFGFEKLTKFKKTKVKSKEIEQTKLDI